ncbi:MAG: peptide chain release factor N(5)-glutamine methyltransferase [Chitinophagaceae bacterium]|nr:peptide chain release factor N(5)-glutamine methyltransferase [Bacteroidota bacterium]MCC6258691.1 peptide chain release factor N(5)-glutamine methyltransferase [Chitinophagaceae bacterium]MCW5917917.1 peptide chain release factor N(5)-glutamine methyltransferase [Ferruginibacter sp.]
MSSLYPPGEAEAITRLLFHFYGGGDKSDFIRDPQKEISPEVQKKLNEALIKLLEHEPVQYIMGAVDFCGLKLSVSGAALIPRPETEELVWKIIHSISPEKKERILDIGTGTGCIPISIKYHRPLTRVYAIEKSEYALSLAMENSDKLNLPVLFRQMDFLLEENWKSLGQFDVLISNPPYISQSEISTLDPNIVQHEPHLALFVPDSDPLLFYKKIAQFSIHHLAENGNIWLEINSDLANETRAIFSPEDYTTELLKDAFDNYRFLHVTRRFR